jgi:hypothetical protein
MRALSLPSDTRGLDLDHGQRYSCSCAQGLGHVCSPSVVCHTVPAGIANEMIGPPNFGV